MALMWLSLPGGLSVGDFRKVLMKTGLVLVVLGHVSFIAAALLHGTVLRYVAAPSDAVALQYCVVDILSVTSAVVVRPGWEDDWQEGAGRVFDESPPTTWGRQAESPEHSLLLHHYQPDQSLKLSLPQLPSIKWGW